MPKVTVYKFRYVRDESGDSITQPVMATREHIKRLKLPEVLENTAREVDEKELDDQGYYCPPGSH